MEEFDIFRFQKETNQDTKLIYNVFVTYFLNLYEGNNKEKHLKNISKEEIYEIIAWLEQWAIPFYEESEEYEKCARLKKVIEFIKINK